MQLHDDRGRNVRHDSEGEHRKAGQGATREHVEHAQDAAFVLLEQIGHGGRINPGDRDVSADTVHDQCAKQKPQPAPGETGSSAFTKL
jgi:hypothetical protein